MKWFASILVMVLVVVLLGCSQEEKNKVEEKAKEGAAKVEQKAKEETTKVEEKAKEEAGKTTGDRDNRRQGQPVTGTTGDRDNRRQGQVVRDGQG